MAQNTRFPPEPARIALVGHSTHRDYTGTKDLRFLNIVLEIIDNKTTQQRKVYVLKRPGTTLYSNPSGGAAVSRGGYYWARTGKVYTVWDSILYANNTAIKTLATSAGNVSFNETDGATKYLVLVDGTDGYTITTADVATKIADPDFPTPHVPQIINLDGYIFVIKTSTGEVYNSDLDDPTSWDSTNFFVPEMYPDITSGLSRYKNLIVAFGPNSSEFFFDAANATGSPMSRVEQMSQEIGLASYTTIARVQDQLVFVAQAKSGRYVAMIKEEKFIPVSDPSLNRILDNEGASIFTAKGYIVYAKGHPCYVLNLTSIDRTYIYDMILDSWYEWSSNVAGAQHAFTGAYAINTADSQLVMHSNNGKVYTLTQTTNQDEGVNIKISLVTGKFDADLARRKFIRSLEIIGDYQPTSTLLSISWSDDDYKTYSTPRTVDMQGHMFLENCGQTRRRAFKLEHEDNTAFRLEAMELEYDLGVY